MSIDPVIFYKRVGRKNINFFNHYLINKLNDIYFITFKTNIIIDEINEFHVKYLSSFYELFLNINKLNDKNTLICLLTNKLNIISYDNNKKIKINNNEHLLVIYYVHYYIY